MTKKLLFSNRYLVYNFEKTLWNDKKVGGSVLVNCGCKDGRTTTITLEGEFGADALWCTKCQYNLDVEHTILSDRLKEALLEWAAQYGIWIDLETDMLVDDAQTLEKTHNAAGKVLVQKLQEELGVAYTITFEPSHMT